MTAPIEITSGRKNVRARGYIEDYAPRAKTRELLGQVDSVLDEYKPYWPLTIRQVFYRLVGAHDFPKDEAAYGRLCHHMANARRGRRLSFDAIRDDGVMTVDLTRYADVEAFLRTVRYMSTYYRKDIMASQPYHIEVWCEAAGMIHQLANVAHDYSINVYSSSGFDSLTAKKRLADRICDAGKPAVILHLGDYDPSGESIYDSIAEDVAAFVEADKPWGNVDVIFERVALTEEQVATYRLPTAPPKATDSRTKTWEGQTCQLEALAPDQIADILRDAILRHVDIDLMEECEEQELKECQEIRYLLEAPKGGANG